MTHGVTRAYPSPTPPPNPPYYFFFTCLSRNASHHPHCCLFFRGKKDYGVKRAHTPHPPTHHQTPFFIFVFFLLIHRSASHPHCCHFFEEKWSVFFPLTLLFAIVMAAMANKLKSIVDAFKIRDEIGFICLTMVGTSGLRRTPTTTD